MGFEPASDILSKYTVLDLTRVRSGPTCVRQLADWGANVIKIEAPSGTDMGGKRDGSDFQNLHRNKRSLVLDLKSEDGVKIFLKLAAKADVIVENYPYEITRYESDDLYSIQRRLRRRCYEDTLCSIRRGNRRSKASDAT